MITAAVIAGGGIGRRMGVSGGKQFLNLNGKPMMLYSILPFEKSVLVDEIIVVVSPGSLNRCREEVIKKYNLKKVKDVVPGGERRQDSIYNGISAVSDNTALVLIHDGARPMVKMSLVEKVIESVKENDGVIPVLKMVPTVKKISSKGYVIETLDRNYLVEVQTPQVFKYEILMRAYKHVMGKNISITDDSTAVELLGGRVKVVDGDYTNQKVTVPEDLKRLCAYIKNGDNSYD